MKRTPSMPVIPPYEEIMLLLNSVKNIKHKAILCLLYGSGLRVSEVAKLKIGDICSKTMRIRVENAKHGTNRYTILSERGLQVLRTYFKTCFSSKSYKREDWLFPGIDGEQHINVKTIKNVMIKLRNRLELDRISAHTLRHVFATQLLENRVEPVYIQQMLGHKSLKTTCAYLHMTSKSLMGIKSPLNMNRGEAKMIHVQEVFNKFYNDFIKLNTVSPQQSKAARDIMQCRTAEMGGHIFECDECGYNYTLYNSCRNRHCELCQNLSRLMWADERANDVLDAPYFHVVFTLPKELHTLVYQNQELIYSLMYKAVAETLNELSGSQKYLGAQIGFFSMLHTWAQDLCYHPHIHSVVLAGGLTKINKWKTSKKKFFIPVKVLAKKFRGKMLYFLKQYYEQNILNFYGDAKILMDKDNFNILVDDCYKKD